MNVLVDTGVVSSANFLVGASQKQQSKVGKTSVTASVDGFRRTTLDRDAEQQREKDALFTIGRLTRAGSIYLHTYRELNVENWRRPRGREPFLNAFDQCTIRHCPAAIERTKFRSTLNWKQSIAKGGKSDRHKGLPSSDSSQISFLEWLSSLSLEKIGALVNQSRLLHLDDFEIISLKELPWFQALASAVATPESLPDCFHVWTARRNGLDAFLTLEKKLPRTMEQLKNRRIAPIDAGVAVLRPSELLTLLGVTEIDDVPIEPSRFYTYMEISQIRDRVLRGEPRIV